MSRPSKRQIYKKNYNQVYYQNHKDTEYKDNYKPVKQQLYKKYREPVINEPVKPKMDFNISDDELKTILTAVFGLIGLLLFLYYYTHGIDIKLIWNTLKSMFNRQP